MQTQIDTQILEQGTFAPLELLIESGRLIHGDYESWRRREINSLDDVLMGSKEKIRALLESAGGYARSIGLVEQPQTFYAWTSGAVDHGDEPLRLSVDAQLQRLIGSRYVPAQNAPQMDLFFDNPVVALTNGIVRALSARNLGETQRQLDRLYAQAPNHADLAAFDRLLAALGHLDRSIDDPRQELAFLLDITPDAKRLLGWEARDLLSSLWRQLADALWSQAFSIGEPNLHRSFALIQAQDWPGAGDAVHREPQWWLHAPLCLRLAQSCFYQQRRSDALTAGFHLCWRAPTVAADALDNRLQPDTGISALWRRFVDFEEELPRGVPPESPLTAADFPAWLLLREPGLNLQLALNLPIDNTPAEEAYRTVHRWIDARRANRTADELALRKTLQASHPVLFRYLKQSV
ncbi:MAG: hypothetical protein ACLPV8_02830 [Steroidobacteraceae bacterium]